MLLPLFKALHIIGFVAWFAGLFYLVRLFVYHAEAKSKPPLEKEILMRQFKIMEKRVEQLIAFPAMIFTICCGIGMLICHPIYLTFGWMQIKLFFLVTLIGYHFYCKKIIRQLREGTDTHTSFQFRLLNEVPTLILISMVLLAVFRHQKNSFYLFGSLLFLAFLFYFIVKKYKVHREKKSSTTKKNLSIMEDSI